MREIITGRYARGWSLWPPRSIRVVDWNIEQGRRLPAVLDFLSRLQPDLLTLQEVDFNARRTRCLHVAEEIAQSLGMDFVFAWEFLERAEGSRSSPAFTGQATLSRWPLSNPRVIHFRQQSGFWHPRWYTPNVGLFQERLGGRIALAAEVRVGGRELMVYNTHLESRGPDQLRLSQLEEIIGDAGTLSARSSILLAGDFNVEISNGTAEGILRKAGFADAIGLPRVATTPRRGLFGTGRFIDRALIRGPVTACEGAVHSSTSASDHYPVSFTLEFPFT